MELQKKAYDRWADDEVQALLSMHAEDKIQRELERCQGPVLSTPTIHPTTSLELYKNVLSTLEIHCL